MAKDKLPDLLAPGLCAVFCGTAAGSASAAGGAYYAGPGNRFWQVIHDTGLVNEPLQPKDWPRLLHWRLDLTDLAKKTAGNLKAADFDRAGLAARIARMGPHLLAFNGKKAASLFLKTPTGQIDYGLQETHIGETRLVVLPSTSGAARRSWDPSYWRDLAQEVQRMRSSA